LPFFLLAIKALTNKYITANAEIEPPAAAPKSLSSIVHYSVLKYSMDEISKVAAIARDLAIVGYLAAQVLALVIHILFF
jgi:hypothetical protein